ncbi:DEP domain-containing protein 7 [Crenichthys baileyi]|uniref:DEP domain-containing protein 7 n=1 Tax=Crenichthys baileyi TaxID=28760 RepID=A0AAV9QRQ2_9TELE
MAGKPFRATYIWNSIISNLQTHVEVKHRRHNLKSYHDCFLGSEAVDVVLSHITLSHFFGDEAVPRHKAVRLCQALMDSKVFESVGIKVFGKEKKRDKFEDSNVSLYRFLVPVTSSSLALTNTSSQSTGTIGSCYGSPNINQSSYALTSESQEVPSYSTHSPVKREKLLEEVLGNLNLSATITPQMSHLGLSQECLYEVWHQQAVSRLLQLIELPLLESLLEGEVTSRSSLRGMESDPDLMCTTSYLDREVLKAFSEAHERGTLACNLTTGAMANNMDSSEESDVSLDTLQSLLETRSRVRRKSAVIRWQNTSFGRSSLYEGAAGRAESATWQ